MMDLQVEQAKREAQRRLEETVYCDIERKTSENTVKYSVRAAL